MELIEYSDAQSFLRAAGDYLLEQEAQNNLLLSSALSLARSSSGRIPGFSFLTLQSRKKIQCVGLNVAHRKLILSYASFEQAENFGAEFEKRKQSVRAIFGPSEATAGFCKGLYGASAPLENSEQTINQLILETNHYHRSSARSTSQAGVSGVKGLWRAARDKDARLLYRWTRSFVEECQHDETPQETSELIQRYIENRQLFLWENEVGPVAMAGFSGNTPKGVRINMVYTEPKSRGKGYAGALVSALHHKLLSQPDKEFCFLFVESNNEIANRVYEKLGYRKLGQFTDHRVPAFRVSTTG
jgi:RimJ/RimL family protein N-acetyltransferase